MEYKYNHTQNIVIAKKEQPLIAPFRVQSK